MRCKKTIFIIVVAHLLVVTTGFIGCKQSKKLSEGEQNSLKSVYYKMAYSKNGLEYPRNPEILKRCKAGKDKSCLESYQYVQEGRETLQVIIVKDAEAALEYTLDTICVQCGKEIINSRDKDKIEESLKVENECLGALTALFYFAEKEQDEIIRGRLLKQPPKVIEWLGRSRFEWFYNRPEPEKWISAIKSKPDDKIDPATKEVTIKHFQTPIDDIEKFGIMF